MMRCWWERPDCHVMLARMLDGGITVGSSWPCLEGATSEERHALTRRAIWLFAYVLDTHVRHAMVARGRYDDMMYESICSR